MLASGAWLVPGKSLLYKCIAYSVDHLSVCVVPRLRMYNDDPLPNTMKNVLSLIPVRIPTE